MVWIYITLLSVALISLKLYRKIINPIMLFNSIWLVTLLMYNMRMTEFQEVLSERTMLCIWMCILGFNSGVLIINRIPTIANGKPILVRHAKLDNKIKIVNWIIVVSFVVEIIYSKGFPLLWKLMKNGKTYFDFGIPSFNGALYGLVICMGAYTLFQKKNYSKFFYLAFGILVVSRQIVMSIVIEGTIYYLATNIIKIKKKDRRKIIIIMIAAVIFFGLYGNFRTGEDNFNQVFEAREMYKNVPTTFKWVYAYVALALNNFNNLVGITAGNINHGLSMLNAFLPTVLLDSLGAKDIYSPYYLVKINFNVSTYLPEVYLDFGVAGILVMNFLVGTFGMWLYIKMLNDKNIRNKLAYSVFAHNMMLLFFSNFFLNISIMVQFIYAFFIFAKDDRDD